MENFILIVSSPSGAGKSSMVNGLLRRDPLLKRVVTATTRDPRSGEKNGRDYHFYSVKEFENAIKKNQMLEYAKVHNHYYGVPKKSFDEILAKNRIPVLVIDVQGAKTIQNYYKKDCVSVFVMPPSLEELKKRIKRRNDNTKDIKLRLMTAAKEIKKIKMYDYVIVNRDLTRSIQYLKCIVSAEKRKVNRKIKMLKKVKLL